MDQIETIKTGVDAHLDITQDRCPMTYVRVRLALDRLQPGQVLQVTLKGDEPARNVPRTAVEQGHAIVQLELGEITRLRIRKG